MPSHHSLRSLFFLAAFLAFTTGCESGSGPVEPDVNPEPTPKSDAGTLDAGTLDAGDFDAGALDAGDLDAGDFDAGIDGGVIDAGPPFAGFGVISGDCDVIDDELESALPFFFESAIDFGADPFDDPADVPRLTSGGQEIWAAGNAGGSSIESEIFAFEVLARCDAATLLKTENAIDYVDAGKITDLLVEIETRKVGVSVTRAVAFPFDDPYPFERAETLLNDKLSDILESSALVAPEDAWVKQILHVIAYSPAHTETLRAAWDTIDAAIKADTIVYVTATNGDDAFLY